MKTFRDFYEKEKFNDFKEFLETVLPNEDFTEDTLKEMKDPTTGYKTKVILSYDKGYIVIRDKKYVSEIEFDISWDNAYDVECSNIITLFLILKGYIEETKSANSNYMTKSFSYNKLKKSVGLFGLSKYTKTEKSSTNLSKRKKSYTNFDIMLHESALKTYMMYPA